MRISILAYVSMGLAACITFLAYIVNPESKMMLSLLPMLLVLVGVPFIMEIMNRRHVAQMDFSHVKLSRIKDALKKNIGEQVRIRGTVQSVTNKWLNRPHYQIADETGEIGIHMFVAPREDINCGDRVEIIGSLRWSFNIRNKQKKVWGLIMEKIESPGSQPKE